MQVFDMRCLFRKLLLFLLLICLLDISIGSFFDFIRDNSRGGNFGKINFLKSGNSDLVIFGSSRAHYHYNAKIFSDSLNLNCYNAGEDGMGILYFWGIYRIMKKHPKIILYDVHNECDLLVCDNTRFIAKLRPYYCSELIKMFDDFSYSEKIKDMSMIFRYNSQFENLVFGCFKSLEIDTMRGYQPLDGRYKPFKKIEPEDLDSLKIKYLEDFANQCKQNNTRLIYILSPKYSSKFSKSFDPLIQICKKYNIKLLNHYSDPSFVNDSVYFADDYHLNSYGSEKFSIVVSREIKEFLTDDHRHYNK